MKEIKIAVKHENEDPGITAPRKSSVLVKFLFSIVTFMTSSRIFLKNFFKSFKKSLNDVKRRKSRARACRTGDSLRSNRVQASLWRTLERERTNSPGDT